MNIIPEQIGLRYFCAKHLDAFLTTQQTKNQTCSPISLYLALTILAEITDEHTRAQILSILGVPDIDSLRTSTRDLLRGDECSQDADACQLASALWLSDQFGDECSQDDDACQLASALWLSDQFSYQQTILETLKEWYGTDHFRGTMGSEQFNQTFQTWLNQQTGSMLQESVKTLQFNAKTVLDLDTTAFYQTKWLGEFHVEDTVQDLFYSPNGKMYCDFISQSGADDLYWGERFSAIMQPLDDGGKMWFFLPDKGVPVKSLWSDQEVQRLVRAPWGWAKSKRMRVNLNRFIPKFDIQTDLDLKPIFQSLGLRSLGLDDLVRSQHNSEKIPVEVSQAKHAARVMIDEKGCAAAAFTHIGMAASATMLPEELKELDFVLNRPFLFVLTRRDNMPLFVGIVRQPLPGTPGTPMREKKHDRILNKLRKERHPERETRKKRLSELFPLREKKHDWIPNKLRKKQPPEQETQKMQLFAPFPHLSMLGILLSIPFFGFIYGFVCTKDEPNAFFRYWLLFLFVKAILFYLFIVFST